MDIMSRFKFCRSKHNCPLENNCPVLNSMQRLTLIVCMYTYRKTASHEHPASVEKVTCETVYNTATPHALLNSVGIGTSELLSIKQKKNKHKLQTHT